MGNFNSSPAKEPVVNNHIANAEKLITNAKNAENAENEKNNKNEFTDEDTDDIIKTLDGITEIEEKKQVMETQTGGRKKRKSKKSTNGKKSFPIIGGANINLSESSENALYPLENKSGRKRYTKYDLFKILRDLDIETEVPQHGGLGDNVETEDNTSLNDDKSMSHIKDIILKELETLKANKSHQLGGNGCGCESNKNEKFSTKLNLNNVVCSDMEEPIVGGTIIIDASSSSTTTDDSETSSSELGKKKSKSKKSKGKKSLKRTDTESEDSKFHFDTSESGHEDNQTSNEESEEGLSIFPFNSSDVKSTQSIKNYRMLRRKI